MKRRFTEKAEKALNDSVSIAEMLGHTYIGTEHILLSLVKNEGSCSSYILSKHGVDYNRLYRAVCDYSGAGVKSTLSVKDITPRARQVLEESYSNAEKFDGGIIGTDHILYSLVEEKNCVAVKLLRITGADIQEIRGELLNLLKNKEKNEKQKNNDLNAPFLKQYGKNLTELAKSNTFDPVIGRETETNRIIRVLCRKNKNNPCLIGEAGVGKTAIIEGLALRIAKNDVPDFLKGKNIISVDLTSMVAGAKYRGDFEERIKNIVNEVAKNKSVILFIDEIHTIVGAGAAEGAIDAANILKPQLSRAEIQIIGATTFSEYHKYIERDPALERRFQPIKIEEPSAERTTQMLYGLKERYEEHHGCIIEDSAIEGAVKFSVRYISDRYLPDKAIDLLDEACAYAIANKDAAKNSEKIFNPEQSLKKKEAALLADDYNLAVKIKELEDVYRTEYEINQSLSQGLGKPRVTVQSIKAVVSEITGISSIEDTRNYPLLEERLNKRVIGQTMAIHTLVGAIKRYEMGLVNIDRPKGIFLFTGPSGVGKTSLASALAKELFPTDSSFIRLDMSEYSEKHSVSKLIGSPPGYVGSDEGGKLTEAIRRNPNALILLDEIEKADKDVINLFLQMFDYGMLTDSQGRTVSFRNVYIIMTTNIYRKNSVGGSLGFVSNYNEIDARALLDGYFRPEFINRIDEVILFERLSKNAILDIAKKHVEELCARLNDRDVSVKYSADLLEYVINNCDAIKYGARSIIRFVHSVIENKISDKLLDNIGCKSIYIQIVDGELRLEEITASVI